MDKKEILDLLNERDLLYEKNQNDRKVDEIEIFISKAIIKNFDNYEVDFIVETLTRFGQCPYLLCDDNGMFAISSDGYSPFVSGDNRIEGNIIIHVTNKQWKNSIREALKYFMNEIYNVV